MVEIIQIDEGDFTLTIHRWNDITLKLFKEYSDWRCNNHTDLDISNTSSHDDVRDIDLEHDMKMLIREKTLEEIEKRNPTPSITEYKKAMSGIPMFPEDQVLARTSEYGGTPLYKPILDYILNAIDDSFSKKDVYLAVQESYKEHGRNIKLGSAIIYGGSYCKYLVDKGIATDNGNNTFQRIGYIDNTPQEIEHTDNTNGLTNEEPLKTFIHNPNVTHPTGIGRKPLIEEWIRKTKKLEFTLEEYFMVYPNQRRGIEMLYTHISRLIDKKLLLQIGENRFKIMV